MKKILIITGRYLPGYKDGGPVRTIANLVDYLGDEYDFKILTADRDHGDNATYKGVQVNQWNRVGKADVFYVKPHGFTASIITKLSRAVDIVYLCGCFSDYSIAALILKRIGKIRVPVVVAPMGLFMPNAMKKKPLKYNVFIKTFKALGMFEKVYWSTTSSYEAECTRKVISKRAECYVAEDLPRKVEEAAILKKKEKGSLKVFFISRISPEKNLLLDIEILSQCKASISFDIYGPIHDEDYWKEVQLKIKELPSNICVTYKGMVDSTKVVTTLKSEHVFLFTTIGENYSHVIQEALSAGCPCIISDQTPWQDLEINGAGYVFPLNKIDKYVMAVEKYAEMNCEQFQNEADKAHLYVLNVCNNKVATTGYRKIFDTL